MQPKFDSLMSIKYDIEENLDKKVDIILKHKNMKPILLEMIKKRFFIINTPDDFLANDTNIEKLDSISMRLLAIGEGLKNIDKLSNYTLLKQYPKIEWKNIKGLRDIITHHYFDLNSEIIFDICDKKIDPLCVTIKTIIQDLQ